MRHVLVMHVKLSCWVTIAKRRGVGEAARALSHEVIFWLLKAQRLRRDIG
jgi:hypothetical protein